MRDFRLRPYNSIRTSRGGNILIGQFIWETLQSSHAMCGGERGIRTLETVTRLHAFQACAFDHSATSPLIFARTHCELWKMRFREQGLYSTSLKTQGFEGGLCLVYFIFRAKIFPLFCNQMVFSFVLEGTKVMRLGFLPALPLLSFWIHLS